MSKAARKQSTTPRTTVRPHRPWRTAGVAGMASYLDAGVLFTTGTALVLYAPSLGVSSDAIGAINGMLAATFAIGSLFGGWLGDRFGRRRVFTFTLILYIIGVALATLALNVGMLFAAAAVTGLAIGADLPVSLALVNEEAPSGKKGQMVALTSLLWFAGIAGPLALSAVVAPLGEIAGRILYGHLLVVAVAVLVLRLTIRESAEWVAAREASDIGSEQIQFSRLPQVFRAPMIWPTLALGLYVTLWALNSNTFGTFSAFFFTALAGTDVQFASLVSFGGLLVGLLGAIVFIRVADTRARWPLFVMGTMLGIIALLVPFAFGPSTLTLSIFNICFAGGAAFSGEAIYKLWSQELVPTLLRGTVQGIGLAISRIVTAIAAFVIPGLALANPTLLFGLLFLSGLLSALIGLFWIPRLPLAADLETAPVVVIDSSDPDTAGQKPKQLYAGDNALQQPIG